jgi:hypothetical protein
MSLRPLFPALAAGVLACQPSPAVPDTVLAEAEAATPRVESGTSFGMCAGYCMTRLIVEGGRVTLLETAWRSELPDRSRTLELTVAERVRFYAALDPAAVRRLAGVHGCPDCADGGAEWIELDRARVTFEFGRELAPIAPLQRETRALRARLR